MSSMPMKNFWQKYKKGVDEDIIYKINRYYETSQKYGTMTKELFKIREDFIKTNNNFDFIQKYQEELFYGIIY